MIKNIAMEYKRPNVDFSTSTKYDITESYFCTWCGQRVVYNVNVYKI